MRYSSPRVSDDKEKTGGLMPSSNWNRYSKRAHAGRQTENCEELSKGFKSLSSVRSEPIITNSVNHVQSAGLKTGVFKTSCPNADGNMARSRLQLDEAQPNTRRSERRHIYGEHPPYACTLISPSEQTSTRESFWSPRDNCIGPELTDRAGRSTWYGDAPQSSRRHAGTISQLHQVSRAASQGVEPQKVPDYLVNCSPRDLSNSDLVRSHLGQAPLAAPITPVVSTSHPMYCYGDISCLPSTTSKDSAYLHSGLKMSRMGPRAQGMFSPNRWPVMAINLSPRGPGDAGAATVWKV